MRFRVFLLTMCLATTPALAQDDDGGFLERTLEDVLSGEGRDVQITGFAGALSSTARLDRMTFTDADGVWFTLEEAELSWNRAALFRGRVQVERLTAASIEILRPPLPSGEGPSAEAPGFSLPDLPVSVSIGEVSAGRVILGEALLGVAAELSLDGAMELAGGEGSGRIVAERIDGARGRFEIAGSYSNATEVLSVALGLSEAPGGLAATLTGLPGGPALDLSAAGEGPIRDFEAELALATEGVDRVTGSIALQDGAFQLGLSGDVAPLVFPQYRAFFGPDIALRLSGERRTDGSLGIGELALETAQLDLAGSAEIGVDGLPRHVDLAGRIASDDGTPVILPIPGGETRIDGADLVLGFDAARGEDWTGTVGVSGFVQPGLRIEALRLTGRGRIEGEGTPRVSGTFDFAARALDLSDPDAGVALGEDLTGGLTVDWQEGNPVEFSSIRVEGETYGLEGEARVAASENGPAISGRVQAEARDLAVFSGIAGRPLKGTLMADFSAETAPVAGLYDLALRGAGRGLAVGIPEVDRLLGEETEIDVALRRDEAGIRLERLTTTSPAAEITASGRLTSQRGEGSARIRLLDTAIIAPDVPGPIRLDIAADGPPGLWDVLADIGGPGLSLGADLTVDLTGDAPSGSGSVQGEINDLTPFGPRIGRNISGSAVLEASGALVADLSGFDIEATVATEDLTVGQAETDRILAGAVQIRLSAQREGATLTVRDVSVESAVLDARGSGSARLGASLGEIDGGSASLTATLLNSEGLLPGMPTPLRVALDAEGTREAVDLDIRTTGAALSIDADTRLDLAGDVPEISGTAKLDAGDLAPFSGLTGRTLGGAITLDAEGSLHLDLSKFDLAAEAETRDLRIGQSDVDALLAGAGQAAVIARREGAAIAVERLAVTTPLISLDASGTTGKAQNAASFEAEIANVARWVPALAGRLRAVGTARQEGGGAWDISVDAQGPGGAVAGVTGSAAPDFGSFALAAIGSAPLQAANAYIAPRALVGTARFDLRLDGPPALGSLSGRVETAGARFAAPTLGVALSDLGGRVDLAGGTARIDLGGAVRGGGRIAVTGPLTLTSPFPAELTAALQSASLTDPGLYRTRVSGEVSLEGGLAGGARIGGALALSDTEILIPSGTSAGAAPSLDISHVNEPSSVRQTRARAGLLADGGEEGGGGTTYPLALVVDAPNRIFLRGRGLEAELGGRLRLGGSTRNVVPEGQFELIRGRLDILGQRFQFDEGTATLQGDFNPYIRLVAATEQDDTTIRVVVEGLAASPEILFQSEPELPEDEVLARLLFDRGIDTLSPLQAAQLASAVATLTGRGGDGIVGRLRQNFGLDDLDVTSDGEGGAAVRAGRYISDNVYSDVTVNSAGETDVSINLDISPSVTMKGSVGSEGNTGIGIFFERDY